MGACRHCGGKFEKHTSRHAFCTVKHRKEYYLSEERKIKAKGSLGRRSGGGRFQLIKPKPISEEEMGPEFAELDRLIAADTVRRPGPKPGSKRGW